MRSKSGTLFPRKARLCHACLLLLAIILVLPGITNAQTKSVLDIRITYKTANTPLLRALKDIRSLTNVRLSYNSDIIRRQPSVTIDVKQATLGSVLKQLLATTKLQFEEDMGGITIYPAEGDGKNDDKKSFLLTGQVTSEDGTSLAGVSIRALTSNIGTITEADGMYSLMVYDDEMLRFSLLGMKTVTLKAEKSTLMSVKLSLSPEEIKEVVVNGYQRIEQRMATAATYKLEAAEILQPGAPSVDKMLQGKVPGLMIMNTSGGVNSTPVIRMRGTSTFIGNAAPLWVIDGMIRPDPVPLSTTDLNSAVNGNFSMIGSAISGLNPYDIESMTFLRDAAATAIYGTQAANGVIVVQTRRGKAGPMRVNYNTDMSFQARPSYTQLNLMNSKERIELSQQILEDGLVRNAKFNSYTSASSYEGLLKQLYARQITEDEFKRQVQASSVRNTDWFDVLFRNSFSMTHSLSLSGGTDQATWYASVSYSDNNGAAKLDGFNRYTADIGLTANVSKRLKVDLHMLGTYKTMDGYYNSVNPLTYALETARYISPDETYDFSNSTKATVTLAAPPIQYNVLNEIANTTNSNTLRSTSLSLNMSYNFGGGWRFQHMSSAAYDAADAFRASFERSYAASATRGWNPDETDPLVLATTTLLPKGGMANFSSMNSLTLNTRNSINFTKLLFGGRDQFDFTLGMEVASAKTTGFTQQQPGYFPDRGRVFYSTEVSKAALGTISLTDLLNNSLGTYATAAYNLMGRYTLGFTVRRDGSNRFGQYSNARFLPNYGLSGRWDVTQEKWLRKNTLIDRLSVRGSFGTQGKVVTEVSPNLIASFIPSNETVRNLAGRPPVVIKSLPYPDLRWEKTYQWDGGVDLNMFQNRINLQVDVYGKKSVDLITSRAIPVENGVDKTYVNSGTMLNTGLEFLLNVVPLRKKNMELGISFSNSFNHNKIAGTGYNNTYIDYLAGTAISTGRAASGFYSFAYNGLNGQTGLPQFKYMESTGKEVPVTDFLVYSGQLLPKFFGKLTPSFRYKNFSASANLYYSLGASKRLNPLYARRAVGYGVPSALYNANRDLKNRWRKPGDEQYTDAPVLRDVENTDYFPLPAILGNASRVSLSPYVMYDQSDLRVVNASFIRCNVVSLNYTVPRPFLGNSGIKSLQLSMSVNNPFTIASRKLNGQDPEIDGVGTTALPITRQYAWGIRADF